MRTLSHTSMDQYTRCPQGYKLKYLDGHPQKPAPQLNRGSAVHAALEAFYKNRLNGPPPLTHVLDAFDEAFRDEAYLTFEEREDAYADGTLMVQEFYAKHAKDFKPAMAVEPTLRFEVDGIRLEAKIDRVDKLENGRVRIVDYKSGKMLTREMAEESPQLSLYQIAVEDQLKVEVDSLELYHVPSQTPIVVPRRTEDQLEEARQRVRDVVHGIESGDFEPIKQSKCNWCDWREWCSLFADWYPENWEQEALPPAPSHEEAQELADRFGEAKARENEARKEAAEARKALELFFEATGERAVAGERFRVTGSATRGVRFDHDELRAILEPAGLWEKVLKPDYRQEEKLLSDPEVPESIKTKLREMAREKAGWRVVVGDATN